MTLSATVRLDSPALETSVEHAPDVDVTLEQQTRTADGALDLTIWGSGSDLSEFETGLSADETVSRWLTVGETESRKLYRTRLTEQASSSMDYHGWTDGKAVFLSTRRETRGWTIEAYLPDRSVLQQFAVGCESNDVQFDLLQISEVDDLQDSPQCGLSELQAKTLLTAYDQGYYSVPREVNLEELASPLDVSHQAVSERLRRGVCSLIENTIAGQWDEDETPAEASELQPTGVTAQEPTLEASGSAVGLD